MDTSTNLQASEITAFSDAKRFNDRVDSGYETPTTSTSTEPSDNLSLEAPPFVVGKRSDLPGKGGAIHDASEKSSYVTSLKERLEQAENELKNLKSGNLPGMNPTSDSALPVNTAEPDREAKISRMTYKQFRLIKPDMKPAKATAAIIVCYDEIDMHCINKRSKHSDNVQTELPAPGRDAVPTHIAINSQILADIITPEVDFLLRSEQNVFIAPFKGFIIYEDAIRKAFKRRTTECETEKALIDQMSFDRGDTQLPDGGSSLSSNDTPKQDQNGECDNAGIEITDIATRNTFERRCAERDLLGCLVEVMDIDLRAIFELRRQLQDGKTDQTDIAYKDLWHLYKPGDIVISSPAVHTEPQQAYRVLHVTGGRTSYERLYPPEVVAKFPSVMGVTGERIQVSSGVTPVVLDCVYVEYDGTKYGPRTKSIALQDYSGLKAIKSLELFPIRFSDQTPDSYTSLIERGKKYAGLRGGVSKLYKGLTLVEVERSLYDDAIKVTQRQEVNSEIILDQKAGMEYREKSSRYDWRLNTKFVNKPTRMLASEIELIRCEHQNCFTCTDIHADGGVDINAGSSFIRSTGVPTAAVKDDLTEDHYAVLTPRIYGYALQERKWHPFNVENIMDHEVSSNKLQDSNKSFDNLVLREGHKKLLKALISNQTRQFQPASRTPTVDSPSTFGISEDMSMDLVRGKGKGVIILLHGVPGVGKTSTAECVASHLGRPLFPITCGDLGLDARSVETSLEEYFTLASKWGCVLLLDEADVFLAKRSEDQLKRNALVSVFLRVLEYYSGVLMLTTNRVGSFDEAFRSRIHISLYYPKLGKEETSEIWEMNLKRIKEATDVNVDIDEAAIRKFYKNHWKDNKKKKSRRWNGRQIKNAFQTALALANWDFHNDTNSKLTRPNLKARHFKQVAETCNHFDDYLADLLREGEDPDADVYAAIARRERLRDDMDRGHGVSKQSKRRDRSEDSESDSVSSDSDRTKRKHSKREKEKKKSRSRAKKSELLDSASDDSGAESGSKTETSESEPEKRRNKHKAAKKDTKKSKSNSKKERRTDSEQEDASGTS